MTREIDVPMLLSTLLRRQVSALVSSTAHEIAAFTKRDPAEEKALLCKAFQPISRTGRTCFATAQKR